MLLYTHFVWTLDLSGFFGTPAILSNEFVYGYHDSVYAWSHLYLISSSWLLWFAHLAGLIVFAMLMIGYQTRIVGWLACALTISYAHRATGALFGLDQVNGFLALYLAVGPSGDVFSVDAWLAPKIR